MADLFFFCISIRAAALSSVIVIEIRLIYGVANDVINAVEPVAADVIRGL